MAVVLQPEHGLFGSDCVNEYQLFSDMIAARNHIYEYHTCYTGRKDYDFINKTIKAINEFVSSCSTSRTFTCQQ